MQKSRKSFFLLHWILMLCVKIAWKRMQTKEKQKAIREKRALEIEHNLREQGKRTRKTNKKYPVGFTACRVFSFYGAGATNTRMLGPGSIRRISDQAAF